MLSLSLNPLLCLSLLPLCLILLSILPILVLHKFTDDLMRDHHCYKLIEPVQMFHMGIAHNTIVNITALQIANTNLANDKTSFGNGNHSSLIIDIIDKTSSLLVKSKHSNLICQGQHFSLFGIQKP
jgi:hypothetical protein